MNDTNIDDLILLNNRLEQLMGIFTTVFRWFEDVSLPFRNQTTADFFERLYILTESHEHMTEKIRNKLNELWHKINTDSRAF